MEQGPEPLSENKQPRSSGIGISEGITLLLLSAAAYVGAYLYESSYLSAFGVPLQLVEVSTLTLVSVGASLTALVVLLAQFLGMLADADKMGLFSESSGWSRYLKKWGIFWILTVVTIVLFRRDWLGWLALGLWMFVAGADLIAPLTLKKKDESFSSSLSRWLKDSSPSEEKRSFTADPGWKKFYETVGLVAVFTLGCTFAGAIVGRTERSFGFVDKFEENVILRRNGDRYLLVKYDWDRREFVRQFRIVGVSEIDHNIVWRRLDGYIVRLSDTPIAPPAVRQQ